mgnify:CR=1 FL=1
MRPRGAHTGGHGGYGDGWKLPPPSRTLGLAVENGAAWVQVAALGGRTPLPYQGHHCHIRSMLLRGFESGGGYGSAGVRTERRTERPLLKRDGDRIPTDGDRIPTDGDRIPTDGDRILSPSRSPKRTTPSSNAPRVDPPAHLALVSLIWQWCP